MKGRKNIFKIAITSVLSATMCLTGALAVKSVMPAKAFAETTVNTSSIVDNVVYSGNNAAATYVTDKAQVSLDSSRFSGLRLTGGEGAKFDLGNFKLDDNKFYWNGNVKDDTTGTYTGTNDHDKAANADNAKSYGSFFSYVYDPAAATDVKGDLELNDLVVTLKEVGNESNFVTLYVQDDHAGSGKGNDNGFKIRAKATGNTTFAVERYYADGTGFVNARKQLDAYGNQTTPIDFVWDNATATAYSNTSFGDNYDGIGGAWGIRQFNQPKSYYAEGTDGQTAYDKNGFSQWAGFTSGATLNCTVEFPGASGVTSIIVTSFGGYDLTKEQQDLTEDDFGGAKYNAKNPSSVLKGEDTVLYAPVKSSVITSTAILGSKVEIYDRDNALESTVTFNNATETYAFKKTGAYTLKWYDAAGSLIETTTVKSVTAVVDVDKDIASKITSNTGSAAYIANKKQVSNNNLFSGIRLTGVTGSTFNLGNFKLDGNKLYWNGNVKDNTQGMYIGTNDRNKAANADNAKSYGSFFSYVYDPNSAAVNTGDLEVYQMIVKLTEVGNESNWMNVSLTRTYYDNTYTKELQIIAAATNNVIYGVERHYAAGTKLGVAARKNYAGDGTATQPLDLVWDNEKATVYTNTSYNDNFDGIGGAWALRQFAKDSTFYADDAYTTRKYSPWNGFTDGATLNCTVEFADVKTSEPTSIIVTSLGGVDLTSATYPAEMTVETKDVGTVAGVKCNLLDGIYMTDGLVKVAADVAKITVSKDGAAASEVDLIAAKTYEFAEHGTYTVTYYDNAGEIGSSTYTIDALTVSITVTGGVVKKGDAVVNTGDPLSLEDELTFVPTGSVTNTRGTIMFDVLRSLTINGSVVSAAENQKEYAIKVADCVKGSTLSIDAVFDAQINIYMTDDRANEDNKLYNVWASDGVFSLIDYKSSLNEAGGFKHFKEVGDDSVDLLVGIGRYFKNEDGTIRRTEKVFTAKPAAKFSATTNDSAFALQKDNYFEATWINMRTRYALRVGDGEDDSGMRMITEFKESDVERYKLYNEAGLNFSFYLNYTTTDELAKAGITDLKKLSAYSWAAKSGSAWGFVEGTMAQNGMYVGGRPSTDPNAGIFFNFKKSEVQQMFRMGSGVTDGYIGYAVTLVNFNVANINLDYVFQSSIGVDALPGCATGCVGYAKTAKMSTLATDVYNAAFGAEGSEYQYAVTVDGETKYSKYNQNQIDWLRKMAGKA